jgi:D-alanyl-D-alanine carboxypeptidase
MGWVRPRARYGLRYCVFGLAALAAGLFIASDAADARHHRRVYAHYVRHVAHVHHRSRHAEEYAPPFSSLVVDGNSGEILQASNADAIRHPASLTKIMTLYLLFEALDAGRIGLDTPLRISAHAAEQAPSKLGLKPGQTIAVEDAIKAVVTKSANDVAVAIAENLAGSEEEFARAMTQKAHALGMAHTNYVNASGLPDDEQLTTARDLALLGRTIADHFPRYYRYFATPSFVYHGSAMRNHNHLLGAVAGVDGIKTGYTRDSGFNLVTSVHRDGRYLVAVVLGGHSAFARDARMRELINSHIREAALRRTNTRVAERMEKPERQPDPQPTPAAKTPVSSRPDPTPTATVNARASGNSGEPIRPVMVKTISYRTAPTQTATLAPMPSLTPVAAAAAPPAPPPAAPAARISVTQPGEASRTVVVASAEPGEIASGVKVETQRSAAAKTETAKAEIAKAEIAKAEVAKAEAARAEVAKADVAKAEPPMAHAHGGWLIQIGAFDAEEEARQHLSAAQSQARTTLAAAEPFTERVRKGDKALYRARFAGFDRGAAEAACRELKRSDFECMAVKN